MLLGTTSDSGSAFGTLPPQPPGTTLPPELAKNQTPVVCHHQSPASESLYKVQPGPIRLSASSAEVGAEAVAEVGAEPEAEAVSEAEPSFEGACEGFGVSAEPEAEAVAEVGAWQVGGGGGGGG